jgi:hypothetical protein
MIAQTPLETNPETTTDTLVEKIHQLSSAQQQEALTFIEFLIHRDRPRKTIWDKIEERIAKLPEEVWDQLPIDGALEHDHYLYGTPKKGA